MTTTTRRSSNGGFKRLRLALKELDGVQGKVGYFESARYEDGTPVAYIAAIQELGHAGRSIPPRPTLGPAIEANLDKYKADFAKGAKAVIDGKRTATEVMEVMMLVAAGDVGQAISDLTSPPLSPVTLLARMYKSDMGSRVKSGKTIGGLAKALNVGPLNLAGVSTKPLVDTKQMIQAVTGVAEPDE